MKKSTRIVVPHLAFRTNLLEYCIQAFPVLGSRTAVKKAIFSDQLLLNDRPAKLSDHIQKGDVLELRQKHISKRKSIQLELPVVFEDDHLIIVNKPGGIAVNGNRNKTVENAVRTNRSERLHDDRLPQVVAVHRIDVPTKGLVMLAKTKRALVEMGRQFQQRAVKKVYYAIAHGKMIGNGSINQRLADREAITDFEVQRVVASRKFKHLSLVRLMPRTGRTHQLRLHLQQRGHLIVGDKQYAARQQTILGKGLFLCATDLAFQHPITQQSIHAHIDMPDRFHRLLERETSRF
ncbi:MAG: RluA family pseudouridine synthase [Bacteroidota bacterium]